FGAGSVRPIDPIINGNEGGKPTRRRQLTLFVTFCPLGWRIFAGRLKHAEGWRGALHFALVFAPRKTGKNPAP
ncbi:hypothetical protein, partial [Staphylococcus pasteuri_A]